MKRFNLILSSLLCLLLLLPMGSIAQFIAAFAGNGTRGYSGDGGSALSAECFAPLGMAVGIGGELYMADNANNVIRKVSTSGIITTFAGTGVAGYSGDAGVATMARLNQPTSIAIDNAGNVFFTDGGNSVVRKVDVSGIITTVAGTGTAGFSGANGPATSAMLNKPQGIAIDIYNNLYIADTYNQVIREVIDSNKKIVTIAGTGNIGNGASGMSALITDLNYPKSVAVDTGGNVFIVDQGNDIIRRVDYLYNCITVAGTGVLGYSGDGGYGLNAKLNIPATVIADRFGDIFFTDYANHVVRKETRSGVVSTYAGNGTSGSSGNGGPAILAEFKGPYGLAISYTGELYVSDEIDNTVRKIAAPTAIAQVSAASGTEMIAFPNPTNGKVTIKVNAMDIFADVAIIDLMGHEVIHEKQVPFHDGMFDMSLGDLPAAHYLLMVVTPHGVFRGNLTVTH